MLRGLRKCLTDITQEFDNFIREGGFPKTLQYQTVEDKRTYVQGIISEIFEKDIRRRVKVRNAAVFHQVQTYIINNFGATASLNNIRSDLRKNGCNIKRETLNRYIQILIDAKILCKCGRFDLKSRRSLLGKQKYYLADLSFYFALGGSILFLCSGGNDGHEQFGNGRQGVCTLGKDSG